MDDVPKKSTGVRFKNVVFLKRLTVRSTTRTLITDKNDHSAFTAIFFLREGPRLKGGYSGGSGSGVPPYDFLNLYGVSDCRFCASFS